MGKKFLTRRVKNILIAALCLTVVVTLSAALTQGVGTGKNIVGTVLAPLRAGIAAFDRGAERIYNSLFRYDALEAENAELRKQLAQTQMDRASITQYQREIRRLENLLELKENHTDYTFAAANVISWGTSAWESTLTIDRGRRDGLEEGLCAVTESGQVVGILTECGTNWSTVSTVFDEGQTIAAALMNDSGTGVVQGVRTADGTVQLEMDYLPTDAEAEEGAVVVTSGSIRYPGGLMLGTVRSSEMDRSGVWRYAVLDSTVRTDKLEQVFLITGYTNE